MQGNLARSVTKGHPGSRANQENQAKTAEKDVLDIQEDMDPMEPMALQASPGNLARSEAVVPTDTEERGVPSDSRAKLDPWAHAALQAKTAFQVRLEKPVDRASQERSASAVTVVGVVPEETSVVPVSQVPVDRPVSRELRERVESREIADPVEVPDCLDYRARTEHLACQEVRESQDDRVNPANLAYRAPKVPMGRKAPKENVVVLVYQAPVATPVHMDRLDRQGSPEPRTSTVVTAVWSRNRNHSIPLSVWVAMKTMMTSTTSIMCARPRVA